MTAQGNDNTLSVWVRNNNEHDPDFEPHRDDTKWREVSVVFEFKHTPTKVSYDNGRVIETVNVRRFVCTLHDTNFVKFKEAAKATNTSDYDDAFFHPPNSSRKNSHSNSNNNSNNNSNSNSRTTASSRPIKSRTTYIVSAELKGSAILDYPDYTLKAFEGDVSPRSKNVLEFIINRINRNKLASPHTRGGSDTRRRPIKSQQAAWTSTGRKLNVDGVSRALYANSAKPGELRIRRMVVTRAGARRASYVKP